jgi:putative endonuclease
MSGWAYLLRCVDGSFYAGSTSYDDIDTRVGEHNDGRFEGYTHSRRPVILVWAEQFSDLRDAQDCERRIKGWRREKKEALARRDLSGLKFLAKRAGARRPSRAASRPPQGDALFSNSEDRPNIENRQNAENRHPEVRAQRASKDDGSI